jgi:excisionase family DNA binding protein
MEKLLTISEAAELLQVRPRTLYEMTSARGRARNQHPLPVIRLNAKCLRFRREDLEMWVGQLAKERQ